MSGSWIELPRISYCKVSSPSTKCNTSQISRKPWCTRASLLITPHKAIRWWAYPLMSTPSNGAGIQPKVSRYRMFSHEGIVWDCLTTSVLPDLFCCRVIWNYLTYMPLGTCTIPSSYRTEQTAIRLVLFHSRRKECVVRKTCKDRT